MSTWGTDCRVTRGSFLKFSRLFFGNKSTLYTQCVCSFYDRLTAPMRVVGWRKSYTPTPIESIYAERMTGVTTDIPVGDARNLISVVQADKPVALIDNDESDQSIQTGRDMGKIYTLVKTRDELLIKVAQREEAPELADRVYKRQVTRTTELESTANGLTICKKMYSKLHGPITSTRKSPPELGVAEMVKFDGFNGPCFLDGEHCVVSIIPLEYEWKHSCGCR